MTLRRSEPCDRLAAALQAFQQACPNVPRTETAEVPTKAGGSYSYRYADLAGLRDHVQPHLTAAGLVLVQPPDGAELVTLLIHAESGQWLEGRILLPDERNGQALGSQITYRRRYAMAAVLGIAMEDEDDDGEAAQRSAEREAEAARRAKARPAGRAPAPARPLAPPPTAAPSSSDPRAEVAAIVRAETLVHAVAALTAARTVAAAAGADPGLRQAAEEAFATRVAAGLDRATERAHVEKVAKLVSDARPTEGARIKAALDAALARLGG